MMGIEFLVSGRIVPNRNQHQCVQEDCGEEALYQLIEDWLPIKNQGVTSISYHHHLCEAHVEEYQKYQEALK